MSVNKEAKPTQNNAVQVASPCIRHCCLDNNDICVGCKRTLQEIIDWQSFDNEQKNAVIRACQSRKAC
uniref:DUF1289 domain-containing protein n=2 Tax=Pseudoalteromonas rubra TaxID=43658 RepID=A0A0F4QMZ0_9GAMM|nr:DUF1289 domain-containing protein [Pseudoalteromonas rubra]KJZ08630.1 hypothetical protein TW77_12050 [Pseudoalteromonas rubra]